MLYSRRHTLIIVENISNFIVLLWMQISLQIILLLIPLQTGNTFRQAAGWFASTSYMLPDCVQVHVRREAGA